MRAKLLIPALAAALACLCGCDFEDFSGFNRVSRDFHYNYPLKTGGRIELETFNGSVEISSWDQNTVDISGTKTGPSEDAVDLLKVSVENTPDSVSVRVVRPAERRNNLGARFVVKVPRNAYIDRIVTSNGHIRLDDVMGPVRLRTSNGQVRVNGLRGNLDAQTSNGSVELAEVSGDATVHSSNGHIQAERLTGSLDATTSNSRITAILDKPGQRIRLGTSNGPIELTLPANFPDVRANTSNSSITVHLPPEANARVVASTSNSSITSDFDMRVHGEIHKNHMDAVLGNGGSTLDLSTSNGAIRLMKGGL